MTKKDYVAIAADFRACLAYNSHPVEVKTIRHLANDMCATFACDNHRFNRDTFLEACGFGSSK